MRRSRKYDLEAIRKSMQIECPHCHTALSPADYVRVDSEMMRCGKCGKDFTPPQKSAPPGHTS